MRVSEPCGDMARISFTHLIQREGLYLDVFMVLDLKSFIKMVAIAWESRYPMGMLVISDMTLKLIGSQCT